MAFVPAARSALQRTAADLCCGEPAPIKRTSPVRVHDVEAKYSDTSAWPDGHGDSDIIGPGPIILPGAGVRTQTTSQGTPGAVLR
jgi:hypothetical protein